MARLQGLHASLNLELLDYSSLQTHISSSGLTHISAADIRLNHTVVFAIQQRNLDLLPDLIRQVSGPLFARPHLTRQEVADLTSDPTATTAVLTFLSTHPDPIHIDTGLHGDYIVATATIKVWEDLFRAKFHKVRLEAQWEDGPSKTLNRALSYSLPSSIATMVFLSYLSFFSFFHLPSILSIFFHILIYRFSRSKPFLALLKFCHMPVTQQNGRRLQLTLSII